MEFTGDPTGSDDLVIRGDPSGREFIAFWLAGRRVVAAMNVNVWDVTDDLTRLIESRAPVDPARLVDPDVALGDVVADRAGAA
jgi:3-phenylpropionate/trans-cinnamate dioxygenase ferredoxin reductase component